jgi:hypothetical protein
MLFHSVLRYASLSAQSDAEVRNGWPSLAEVPKFGSDRVDGVEKGLVIFGEQ